MQSSEVGHDDKALHIEVQKVAKKVTEFLEHYRFSSAAELLYENFWHWFCDSIIEKAKTGAYSKDALLEALQTYLKLLHPFMPFVTEEIWSKLPGKRTSSLIISPWPNPRR